MNPEQLKYARTHEWVALSDQGGDKVATIGISKFAIDALTDLVFMELPKVGAHVEPQQPCCEIESVKAVSDIYSPVAGEVIAVNDDLPGRLETLGDDPYVGGWIAKIRLTSDKGLSDLIDYDAYEKMCAEEQH